jgi:5-formyltetrahydrofolate cyclo-ligase
MQCWHSEGISTISDERVVCPILDASARSDDGVTAPTKHDLRRDRLAARRAMTVEEQDHQDATVRLAVRTLIATRPSNVIAAYHPMIGEPGGPSLPADLASSGVTVLLPILRPDRDLDWATFRSPGDLAPAALGLHEPTGPRLGTEAITTADLILVPALAVDHTGARLGRGGGSYDRALARVHPGQLVVALLYPGELLDHVPSEPHDRPVDAVMIDGTFRIM